MKNKIIFILVGIVFIGIGCFIYIKDNNLKKKCTEEVVGTVIEIIEENTTDEDGVSTLYYPIIKYTANNKTFTKKSSDGSNTQKYMVNDKITILYNPNNPEEYIMNGENNSLLFIVIFPIIGIILIIASLFGKTNQ